MTDLSFLFRCDYAKTNRSSCKKCKIKIDKGDLRIAKLKTNPFSDDGGTMTEWYHPQCVFDTFARARATTKKIESPDDIEHFDNLKDEDQEVIKDLIKTYLSTRKTPKTPVPKKQPTATGKSSTQLATPNDNVAKTGDSSSKSSQDDSFNTVITLCHKLENEPSYTAKSSIISTYLKGHSSTNLHILFKLLIPSIDKRVYNVKNKQLVKILSSVLGVSHYDMSEHLEGGNVGETAKVFYTKSTLKKPPHTILTMQQVDDFLQKLTSVTKEDEQISVFKSFVTSCTAEDLKYVMYLIKKDLRINAREKHILEGLHPTAYQAFQMSHDLVDVVKRFQPGGSNTSDTNTGVSLQLMTPIRPMLAEACKSVSQALGKCPQGMYSEIKYDGERVQLHKRGDEFQFYSRSLKPVLPHKVEPVREYIPKAFPGSYSIILDCEVLLVDIATGKPLPFGTLGIHKKNAFKGASVCLFVFDILLFNGESLVDKPIKKRREILSNAITEIPNHVMLSEIKFVRTASELAGMICHVLREGLEGLVLKGITTIYEPGKRHWLKVKKDYLQGGAMADSADLVVLGGYLGTGNKGGMCSVYLMGCYCPHSDMWKTVCKVGNGHDDATLEKISTRMMKTARKIKGDYTAKPGWLSIHRGLMPDYIVLDPKQSDVWEITGAEFSASSTHTAGGISIRFPRVTKIRDDKDWRTATDLPRLQLLEKTSKENMDEALEQLMIREGHGKVTMPKPVTFSKAGPKPEPSGTVPVPEPSCAFPKHEPNNSSSSSSPRKRKLKEDSRDDDANKTAKLESVPTSLTDVFTDIKFYISSKIENSELLARYVVAYDGQVVKDKSDADKIVLSKYVEAGGKIVSDKWLVECIRNQQLSDSYF